MLAYLKFRALFYVNTYSKHGVRETGLERTTDYTAYHHTDAISRADWGQMKANILTLVVGLAGLGFLGIHYSSLPWTPMRVAGAVIALPSLALLVLARIELGSSFSVIPKAQSLVTHGLYSRIRNPIYLFGALVVVGFLLYISRPRALWILVALIPLQIYRSRREEKVLEAKFGTEYQQYKSRTWF
jgi:protein-S-isoprenylcysteine O-methyltransferase Ste14